MKKELPKCPICKKTTKARSGVHASCTRTWKRINDRTNRYNVKKCGKIYDGFR
jgi:hypothetical protein